MALFDLIQAAMGRPDPSMQIAAALGRAPGQPGGGPNPIPAPAAPPAGPQGGGGPAQPPTAGPSPAGPGGPGGPGGAPGGPAAPPQPQAYQSPPDMAAANQQLSHPIDLGQAFLQVAQRQQAAEQFNRGLGLMAAGLDPRNAGVIMSAMKGQTQDPGALFNNLMELQRFGQQQQQYQALQRAAPDLAKKLGMTPDEITAAGPSVLPTLIAQSAPTDAIKNWTQMRQVLRNQGMSEDDINVQAPPSLIMGAGMANLGDRQFLVGQAQAVADNKKNGTPIPPQYQGDLANYQAVMQAHAKLLADQANDLAESQAKFGDQTAKLNEVERITNGIQNATEADGKTPVLQAIMNDPVKKAAAVALMNASGEPGVIGSSMQQLEAGRLSPEEQTAIANLKQLTSSQYATAFTSTGSRRTQQEVQNIASSLSQLGNLNQPYQGYMTSFNNVHKLNQTAMANAYGAAQRLDEVPDNLKPLVNPIYLPAQNDAKGNQVRGKGPLYTGAGGDWATKPLQAEPQPAPAPAQTQQLSAADLAQAKALIARDGRDAVVAHLKAKGYDTSGL
jgi:hypothetical protein